LWPRGLRARLRRNPRLGWTALALDRNIAGSARGDVADGHPIPLDPGRDNALAAAPCRIDAGARVPLLARDRRPCRHRICDGVAAAAPATREPAELEAHLWARRRHRPSPARPRSAAARADHAACRPVHDRRDERIRRAVGTAIAPPRPPLCRAATIAKLG